MFNESKDLNVKPEVVFREEEGGAFLFDPDTGRLCHLNEVGILVWKLCQKSTTTGQIIGQVCSDYPEAQQEEVCKDCLKFLEDLKELGFLSDSSRRATEAYSSGTPQGADPKIP